MSTPRRQSLAVRSSSRSSGRGLSADPWLHHSNDLARRDAMAGGIGMVRVEWDEQRFVSAKGVPECIREVEKRDVLARRELPQSGRVRACRERLLEGERHGERDDEQA